MRLKAGVELEMLSPQMALAAMVVFSVYEELHAECVITSGSEGEHSPGSLHYSGYALDFRTLHVAQGVRTKIRDRVATALGKDFDVLLEDTHLHVEYDPT